MKQKSRILPVCIAIITMIALILDSNTASAGASEGIALCIRVIIPSLFPFFLVTTYLNAALLGMEIPGFRSLSRSLHIPSGSESILLLGLIGGYPVGAKMIADTYKQKQLDKKTAEILLGYCSNAGPAFIFGVTGTLFSSFYITLVLWVIHLVSAIFTGYLLPAPKSTGNTHPDKNPITIAESLQRSIHVCVSVCGWVIVFKIIMAYLQKWLTPYCGNTVLILITGILELSNGCTMLSEISTEPIRFLLCSLFLSFGGICVLLQTLSVTEALRLGLYFHGKIIQSCITIMITIPVIWILFSSIPLPLSFTIGIYSVCTLIIIAFSHFTEKRYRNSRQVHV